MKTDSWITCWSHAQRGCGLVQKNDESHQRIEIHHLPYASAIRFRFSNFYDIQTIEIQHAKITWRNKTIPLYFQHTSTYHLASDETILSDPLDINITSSDVLVLEYDIISSHPCTSGIDVSRDKNISTNGTLVYVFHGIDIVSDEIKGCICAFGDSIVELDQWTQVLAPMVKEKGYILINQGISGNRILRDLQHIKIDAAHASILEGTTAKQEIKETVVFDQIPITKQCFGKPGIKRLKKEILDTHCHMRAMICAIGVNDLYQPGTFCADISELPTLLEMQQAYTYMWKEIKDAGSILLAAGITSFLKSDGGSEEKERMRQDVNTWMKQSTLPDGFVAFDDVLCDEHHVLLDEVHDGDHLHPNVIGGKKMAKKIYEQLERFL